MSSANDVIISMTSGIGEPSVAQARSASDRDESKVTVPTTLGGSARSQIGVEMTEQDVKSEGVLI